MKRFISGILLFLFFQAYTQVLVPATKWKFKTQGTIRSAPVIKNNRLFFANGAGIVYCLDKNNGGLIWEYDTGAAINGSPAIEDSTLYVINRNEEVFALNAASGKPEWHKSLQPTLKDNIGGWKYFTAAPVFSNNRIIAGSGNGHLYVLDASNGEEVWKYKTDGKIRATPLVHKGKIYQPSNDGYVYVFDLEGKKLLWRFSTDGALLDPNTPFGMVKKGNYDMPSIKNGVLVFGSRDGNTYAVDIRNKSVKWKFSYGPTWAMANTTDEKAVYVGWSTNNVFCAIELSSGKEKWKRVNGGHVYTKPLIVGNTVNYGCADGNLYRLNKENGELIWKYQVGSEIFSSPVFDGATIFFGNDEGYMYALEEAIPPHLAVYRPEKIEGIAQNVASDPKLTPFLVDKGFRQITSAEMLKSFILERIEDQNPSVVVFDLPIIPDHLIGENPGEGPIREYLESGGKIVWVSGEVPNFFAVNAEGQFKRDEETGSKLLGVTYQNPSEGGNYYCRTTQMGINMGLPPWTKGSSAIVSPSDDIIPLGIDEFDRINGWMKKFSPRNGSGFICNRTWAWNVGANEKDLEMVFHLAVYGLK